MDSSSIAMIVALVVMVAMSAYFSATETAFTSLNRIRLRTRAENGSIRAAKTLALAEEYDKLLSTILIGNNIVNITATTVATVLCTKWFHQYGPTVSTVALTVIILIFGEITPKSLTKERAESFAMFATPLLKVFMVVLTPVNFFFTQWKKLMGRVFRGGEEDGITEEELVGMVDQAETEGGLDEHESDLIRAAIEFNDLEVSEILTPRVDLVAADEDSTMEEIASLFAESGYSRLPIYHETVDNIVGVIHEKDFYAARYRGETMVSRLKTPVFYTTGNTKISELLRILQKNKAHMAVVVDEYGGTEGIATMEDILEELVGEIYMNIPEDYWQLVPEDSPHTLYRLEVDADMNKTLSCITEDQLQWKWLLGYLPDVKCLESSWAESGGYYSVSWYSGAHPLEDVWAYPVIEPTTLFIRWSDESVTTLTVEETIGDGESVLRTLHRDENGNFPLGEIFPESGVIHTYRIEYLGGAFILRVKSLP